MICMCWLGHEHDKWLLQSLFGSCPCGPFSIVLDWCEIAPFYWDGEFDLRQHSLPDCSGACNNFRRGQQTSLGRVPGKFRENGLKTGWPWIGNSPSGRFGSTREPASFGAIGSVAKLTPRAAAVLCASRRARAAARHQAGAVRPRVGGLRVSDDALTILHPGAAWRARGRCTPPALHRDPAPARLSAVGADDGDRRPRFKTARRPRRSKRPNRRISSGAPLNWRSLPARFDQALLRPATACVRDRRAGHRQELAGGCVSRKATHRACARIAHGQCLDHHGVGEPYLPLIEALTRLAGAPDGAVVKKILAAQAPSWLAQMPSLWTRAERSAMEARGRATRERMLRELTLAVEAMAADVPLLVKARRHSLERRFYARLACTCGAPPRARPADGAGDVPACRCGGRQGWVSAASSRNWRCTGSARRSRSVR